MADRSVKVRLSAQLDEYVSGMEKAAKATSDVGSAAEKLAQQKQAFQMLGASALAMGAVAAAGVTLAVSKWADFDQAMSNVQAATGEGEAGMKSLADAALDAGARTVFSAEESANAIEELAKAGVSTADILGGALDGALDLAAAGGLGVAEAAGIAATALKTFKLEGSDMAHVADLMAAGAGKAMGDVTDLSGAFNQSAMVASAMGLSIEETTGTLAAFASQGLLGSDAGTSFKSMLQSLTPTSGAAKAAIDEYNLSAYDAQGNFIGMEAYAGKLQDGLKDLSTEQQMATMKTIFGSDAVRAATVLFSEGEEGIRGWTDAVDDQGYAAEQAAMRLDNLKGDLEALGGALDTALIKTGSGANDVLRAMVQFLADAVDAYSNLPAPLQGAALGVGILAAGVGILGGGFMLALPKIVEFNIALATLGITGGGARWALMGLLRFITGPMGAGMIAAAATIAVFNAAMDGSKVAAADLETSIKQGSSALDTWASKAEQNEQGLTKLFVDVGGQVDKLPDLLDKAATSGRGFFSSMSFNETAMLENISEFGTVLQELSASDLPRASQEFAAFGESAGLSREQLAVALDEMPGFKSALLDAAEASGEATDDATLLAIALGEVGPASAAAAKESELAAEAAKTQADGLAQLEGKAADTEGAIDELADAIRNFASAELDSRAANRELEASFDDLTASIIANGATLDIGTEKGRANEAAVDSVARAALDAAAATLEQTGSQEAANAKLQEGRDGLINMLAQFGITGAAADEYANKLGLVPGNIPTHVEITGVDAAKASIDEIKNYVPQVLTIQAQIEYSSSILQRYNEPGVPGTANGGLHEFADGGFATGIYKGGTPIHKFAEPETGWEAYISGKKGQEGRNRQIWVESGERLGVMQEIRKAIYGTGGGGGGAPITQNNQINMYDRDPDVIAKKLGRGLRGVIQ